MPSDRQCRSTTFGAVLAAAVLASCAGTSGDAPTRTGAGTRTDAGDAPDSGRFADLAAASFDRGQYGAAVRFYREAADAEPDAAEPRMGMGRALMKLRKPRKAVEAFRAAVQRADDPKAARLGLGRALTAADQPVEAVTVLDRLLEASPGAAQAHLAKGVALDLRGKHAAAQASYKAGLDDAPDDVALRNNLGLSKVLAGEVESGIAMLAEAATRPDATARTRQNLALAHGLRGDMTKAADIARRDLDSRGVQRNLSYYKALHAVWRDDGNGGNAGDARGEAAAEAVRDPTEVSRAVAGPAPADTQPDDTRPNDTRPTDAAPSAGASAPPRPGRKPEPARRTVPVRPPADDGPIRVAAAIGGAADGATASQPGTAASDGGGDGGLARRIVAAGGKLAEGGERGAESHWIQLASLRTTDRAATAKRRIRREFPGLADVIPLSLHPTRLSRTKRVHRVRAGPFTGGEAPAALCRALRERGQGCLVIREST